VVIIGREWIEPVYEIELVERAEGRLLVVVLRREGQYIKEREMYRYMGAELFEYRERHSFDLIINERYDRLDGLGILWHRQSKMERLCRWIIEEFRMPDNPAVSDIPFQYHRAIGRPLLGQHRERSVGEATIIYKELVPPDVTGEETDMHLRALAGLARRVQEEFYVNNNNINLELWEWCERRVNIFLETRRGVYTNSNMTEVESISDSDE